MGLHLAQEKPWQRPRGIPMEVLQQVTSPVSLSLPQAGREAWPRLNTNHRFLTPTTYPVFVRCQQSMILVKQDKNSITKGNISTVIIIDYLHKNLYLEKDKLCFYPKKVTFTMAFKAASLAKHI